MLNVPYNKDDLRQLIRSVLIDFGHWSEEAEELVIGTIAHESLCGLYRRQQGGGPARGIAQMEPATDIDCWGNYLAYQPTLSAAIKRISGTIGPSNDALENNDKYAIVMCRVKYMRSSLALPDADDLEAQAEYWYHIYNGSGVESKMAAYIADYNRLIKES
jgi:hypothetical protein